MNENISNLLRKPGVVPGLVGAAAFATGATLGYLLGKRNTVTVVPAEPKVVGEQLKIDFDENGISVTGIITDEHVAELLRSGSIDNGSIGFADVPVPEEWVGGTFQLPEPAPEKIPEPAVVNIFAIDDPDWDYEAELNTRSGAAPYILHKDEFLNDEMGYHQTTVTYYEGDDILADESDTPVYNYTQLMGPLNWGHGSGDANVVYIRNEKNRQEWEVLLHRGHFSIEVLGNEYEKELAADEMKHSSNRRFRDV
jgi:hypothetical protein